MVAVARSLSPVANAALPDGVVILAATLGKSVSPRWIMGGGFARARFVTAMDVVPSAGAAEKRKSAAALVGGGATVSLESAQLVPTLVECRRP